MTGEGSCTVTLYINQMCFVYFHNISWWKESYSHKKCSNNSFLKISLDKKWQRWKSNSVLFTFYRL